MIPIIIANFINASFLFIKFYFISGFKIILS